jgi:hypothetical protein
MTNGQLDHYADTYKSLVTLATEAFKFCALSNGGAAVAILAYLGNVAGKERPLPDMRCAMAAFLIGLFFCGLSMFFAYLTQLERLNRLARGQNIQRDWRLKAAMFFVILSLAAFATGSMIAVWSFR